MNDRQTASTNPCRVPAGTDWLWASLPTESKLDSLAVGKWLLYVGCRHASYCWDRVRRATESGVLGIDAKISTDWAMEQGKLKKHVVCVYTRDYQDTDDVLRVGHELHAIDAVRSQVIRYKPDVFTYTGVYAGDLTSAPWVYCLAPPYRILASDAESLEHADRLVDELRASGWRPD